MRSPRENPAVEDAVRTVIAAAQQVRVDGRGTRCHVTDPVSALNALDAAERGVAAALGVDGRSLLLDIRETRAAVLGHELARQRSMLPLLSEAISRLRAAATIDELVESVPVHVASLGYERAMFSWVEREHWVPRAMYTTSGPEEAHAVLEAGAPPYHHVRELMEVDVVRRRRSILVLDAATNPRIHPRIAPVTKSHTYVAAPIVARNHVAGFVHLDLNMETGTTDEFDRELLTLYCESVGVMVDRLVRPGAPMVKSAPHAPIADWLEALTPREQEVLRLVADGCTNAAIGARLFISEETTKTHVARLMRKLGVRNRSEAGALFHRQQAWVRTVPQPMQEGPDRAG